MGVVRKKKSAANILIPRFAADELRTIWQEVKSLLKRRGKKDSIIMMTTGESSAVVKEHGETSALDVGKTAEQIADSSKSKEMRCEDSFGTPEIGRGDQATNGGNSHNRTTTR